CHLPVTVPCCTPRPLLPPTVTPFPYTTLFRSRGDGSRHPSCTAPEWRDRRAPGSPLCCATARPGHARRRPKPRWSRPARWRSSRSEEHTSELQSRENLVCRLLLEKKKKIQQYE